ncbi:MAG: conserved phage C-terminal domain-containing protein, partial [Patescibacteria group bacterium]|nr:conserved phage C-terminal domain-containing protein [Patescibacteria group bacterium]
VEVKQGVNPPDKAHMPEARSQNKTLNPLSDSPETPPATSDIVPLEIDSAKPPRLTSEAIEVLDFLNAKTGRYFRRKDAALAPIRARLKEGYTVAECRAVIARKCRAWSSDPKMRDYLRPATLFGSEKFAQYVGEVPPPEEVSNAS